MLISGSSKNKVHRHSYYKLIPISVVLPKRNYKIKKPINSHYTIACPSPGKWTQIMSHYPKNEEALCGMFLKGNQHNKSWDVGPERHGNCKSTGLKEYSRVIEMS